MPPQPKRAAEDAHSLKEKLRSLPAARGRRNGNTNGTSNLKDVISSNGDNTSYTNENEHAGTVWETQDVAVLHSYRRAHKLDVASAFKNPLSHVVLSQGIGRFSPTMARPREKRRVEKKSLGQAVRKHHNNQAVSEANSIVDLLYTVKTQDKEFRVKFAPQRK